MSASENPNLRAATMRIACLFALPRHLISGEIIPPYSGDILRLNSSSSVKLVYLKFEYLEVPLGI
jgi:hypothetical protein